MSLITYPEQFEQKFHQTQVQEVASMQPIQKELDHVQALPKDTKKEADEITRATRKAKGIAAEKLEHISKIVSDKNNNTSQMNEGEVILKKTIIANQNAAIVL